MKPERKKVSIGMLISDRIPSSAPFESIQRAAQMLELDLNQLQKVQADHLKWSDLENIDILINLLGPYFPEAGWHHLLRFYRQSGILLNIGLKPFTQPYITRDQQIEILPETAEAIHALFVVDEYESTGAANGRMRIPRVLDERYAFLQGLLDSGLFPDMSATASICYHLAENWRTRETGHLEFVDAINIPNARVEIAAGWFDQAERLCAAPISRIDHFHRGSLIFLNFVPADSSYYSTEGGCRLLAGMLQTAMEPRLHLKVYPDLPRYFDNETPEIIVEVSAFENEPSDRSRHFTLVTISEDENSATVFKDQREIIDPFQHVVNKWKLAALNEGFYKIKASVFANDRLIITRENGFYKLSQKSIEKKLENFIPISVDTSIATDFMVRGGLPFPMHGTTYFVTDRFRNCLFDFNVLLCRSDLAQLRDMGFNILRTGNWHDFDQFFDSAGNIREYPLRALEAFFLTAALHDFPVQFVLSAYVMNHWNRELCPVHNPEIRKKTLQAFACFAERFKHWPNVQVDAINEPSYSYKGMWLNARPSQDPHERQHFIQWLEQHYHGDLSALRTTWNISSDKLETFEDIHVPEPEQFARGYDSKAFPYRNYACVHDFFDFARESYSDWVEDIRREIKSRDERMVFMMGRDEPLRIPEQQHEAYRKHFEIVNWHQWHQDAIVFVEYATNRVRGLPCCGQELGVYPISDARNKTRLSTYDRANLLERKLCYTFGNWIQWQSFCDPFIKTNVEIHLGLMRYDRTETESMKRVRLLSWIEGKTAHLMTGRREEAIEILLVHPSSLYYSVDHSIAKRSVARSIIALHYHLKNQADVVLEHLFKPDNSAQIGTPKLVIFPAPGILSEPAWQMMLQYVRAGGVALISGTPDLDPYWRNVDRTGSLRIESEIQNASITEKMKIGETLQTVAFRECVQMMGPETVVNKTVFKGDPVNTVRIFPLGKGYLILSPVPVEMGDDMAPITALYRFAMATAGVTSPRFDLNEGANLENILIYPISYEHSTVYTLINEGEAETIQFTDRQSRAAVQVRLQASRACKLWIGNDGDLQGAFINAPLLINGRCFDPAGDACLFRIQDGWEIYAGERISHSLHCFGREISLEPDQVFKQFQIKMT